MQATEFSHTYHPGRIVLLLGCPVAVPYIKRGTVKGSPISPPQNILCFLQDAACAVIVTLRACCCCDVQWAEAEEGVREGQQILAQGSCREIQQEVGTGQLSTHASLAWLLEEGRNLHPLSHHPDIRLCAMLLRSTLRESRNFPVP